MFEPLIPYLHRCRDLKLSMPQFSRLEKFSAPPLRALESIIIDTSVTPYRSGHAAESTLPPLSPLLEAAPQLQSIAWYGRVSIQTIRPCWA
jgi:hypothetical protein